MPIYFKIEENSEAKNIENEMLRKYIKSENELNKFIEDFNIEKIEEKAINVWYGSDGKLLGILNIKKPDGWIKNKNNSFRPPKKKQFKEINDRFNNIEFVTGYYINEIFFNDTNSLAKCGFDIKDNYSVLVVPDSLWNIVKNNPLKSGLVEIFPSEFLTEEKS